MHQDPLQRDLEEEAAETAGAGCARARRIEPEPFAGGKQGDTDGAAHSALRR